MNPFKIVTTLVLILTVTFVGCTEEYDKFCDTKLSKETRRDSVIGKEEIVEAVSILYGSKDVITQSMIVDELGKYTDSEILKCFSDEKTFTRSSVSIDLQEKAKYVIVEIYKLNPLDYKTQDEYFVAIENIVKKYDDYLSNEELQAFDISLDVAYEVTNRYLLEHANMEMSTRATKKKENEEEESWWSKWGKCASGIVGGACTEGIAGAGIGYMIGFHAGAAVGAVVGAIGGGLTGASLAC